jgi:quercetin 2,3-dioxygenase
LIQKSSSIIPATVMASSILSTVPLGFQWPTLDPFLFCVHHDDRYPAGNERMGPAASLAGRRLGMDFEGRDGWRMYHGTVVPGFPQHPHRGFETVTVVRSGLLDHSDSLGGAGRYGGGDVQWLTAGKGILHAEMFPLLDREHPNHVELFQIWLNLPRADKFAEPHYTMFWNEAIPRMVVTDDAGCTAEVVAIAGNPGSVSALPPPPRSWASHPESDIAIWTIKLSPKARWVVPAARPGTHRVLYFFEGKELRVDGQEVSPAHAIQLQADREVELKSGDSGVEMLMLHGRSIGEPVAQGGPFVMNTQAEIRQAYEDYSRTQFGGWPWPDDDHVHPHEEGRFARHTDGRLERPPSAGYPLPKS